MAKINEVVRVNATRVRLQVKEHNKPDRNIPKKYLKPEWIRITEEEEFIEIFGHHVIEAARMIEHWFIAIHVTDPYFRNAEAFKAMQLEIFDKFKEQFKTLAFDKGLTKEKLTALSVYEIAVILKKELNIELKIDPYNRTFEVWERKILEAKEYEKYFVDQLKEECRFFGLKVSGTKEELLARLEEARTK